MFTGTQFQLVDFQLSNGQLYSSILGHYATETGGKIMSFVL